MGETLPTRVLSALRRTIKSEVMIMRERYAKRALALLLAALLLAAFAGCGQGTEASAASASAAPAALEPSAQAAEDSQPAPEEPEDDGITRITLADGDIQIDGKGAGVEMGLDKVTIKSGGVYYLTGTLTNGRVVIKANPSDAVELVLDGVNITSAGNDAIFCKKAGTLQITLAEGSENYLTSGSQDFLDAFLRGETYEPVDDETLVLDEAGNPVETEPEDEPEPEEEAESSEEGGFRSLLIKSQKAAVYSKAPLYITGDGSLTVKGYINHGIQSRQALLLDTANISLESIGDGIKAKDLVTIDSGTYDIHSYGDAISTDHDMDIKGGAIRIFTGDGAESVEMKTEFGFGGPWGWNRDLDDTATGSQKGVKAEGKLTISGGEITVDAADDAIHCGTLATITGGTLELASGDDGVHSDQELVFEGGTVNVSYCYEGVEAPHITVNDGDISVTTNDDGFNAGGDAWEELPTVTINGGNVYVNASGDGLDSNGDLTINGGVIRVDGPSDSMNAALDTGAENGGKLLVNGGELIAIGLSGMMEVPEAESEQVSISVVFTTYFGEDSEILVTDSSNKEVLRFTAIKRGNAVQVSGPQFKLNETYTFTCGDESIDIEVTANNAGNRRGFGGPGGGPGGFGGPPGGPPGR